MIESSWGDRSVFEACGLVLSVICTRGAVNLYPGGPELEDPLMRMNAEGLGLWFVGCFGHTLLIGKIYRATPRKEQRFSTSRSTVINRSISQSKPRYGVIDALGQVPR